MGQRSAGSNWVSGYRVRSHSGTMRSIRAGCAALLAGASVRTVAGTYDDDHWDKAITALLNRQTVAGATLGASRPVAMVRRKSAGGSLCRSHLAQRAIWGRGAQLASSARAVVDPDFAAVIHPRFMPCMLAHMRDDLTPVVAMGPAVKRRGWRAERLGSGCRAGSISARGS